MKLSKLLCVGGGTKIIFALLASALFIVRRFLVSPFVQLKWKSKMATSFFFNGDQLANEVPQGTCLLGPVQYDRTFLGPVQYDRSFHETILNY